MSKTTKSEKWFGKKQKDLTKDELLEFWRLDEIHKKLLKKDREIEKYKRVYVNTNNRLIEKDKQILILEKALELAVADKCKFENALLSTSLGFINGKVAVPKKEQWYLEKAKEMMKSE